MHKSRDPRIEPHAIHVVNYARHRLYFFNQCPRVSVASTLEIRVEQEIHGVELMSLAPHVHSRSLARGRDRSEVRTDIVWPQSYPGKNVRRHVQRMRSHGSNLRVAPRRRKSQLRQLRLVVGMDQVVRHSGMVWLDGKQFLQNRCGLLVSREIRILLVGGRKQRKGIKRCRLVIVGVALEDLFHGVGVSRGPPVVAALPAVECLHRVDVIAFARRTSMQ